MKIKKLRWGLLSTARINRKLIPHLRLSDRNELVAVASRDKSRVQKYAQEWNIPKYFESYEALLADPLIDVIYNSLPNSLHAEWTVKALRAGKHVLCEKPLATTLSDVDAMIQASKDTGRIVTEAFMYRHHAQTLKVKEIIERGVIGDLRQINGAFSFFLTEQNNVRLDSSLDGGCLWDVGCYPVSYARYLVGFEPVQAFGWQIKGKSGVDIHFTGQLSFPGEIFAHFDSSFCTQFRAYFEVVGSKGIIHIPNPFVPGLLENITLIKGDDRSSIEIIGKELYLGEIEDIADAILEGKKPLISIEHSRENTACLLALYRSARTNSSILIKP